MIINGTKYVTEKEISARCGLSTGWFRKERYKNKNFPHYILNRRIYYIEDEVDAWLQKNIIHR